MSRQPARHKKAHLREREGVVVVGVVLARVGARFAHAAPRGVLRKRPVLHAAEQHERRAVLHAVACPGGGGAGGGESAKTAETSAFCCLWQRSFTTAHNTVYV